MHRYLRTAGREGRSGLSRDGTILRRSVLAQRPLFRGVLVLDADPLAQGGIGEGRHVPRGVDVRVAGAEVLVHDDARYLVAPRGHTQWVRNLRAAGSEGELRLGGRAEAHQRGRLGRGAAGDPVLPDDDPARIQELGERANPPGNRRVLADDGDARQSRRAEAPTGRDVTRFMMFV